MFRALCKVNNILNKILTGFIILLLLVMSGMVFTQVIFRFVLSKPIAWSEELSTYLFSFLAYFGAAVVLKADGHISVNSFVERLPAGLQKWVKVFAHCIVLTFLSVVVYMSSGLVAQVLSNGQTLVNIDFLPIGYIFMKIPISYSIMALFTIEKIIRTIKPELDVAA